MRIHRKLLLAPIVFLLCVSSANAQYHSQMGIGNYGTVHAFHLNPSSTAYSAWKWQVNLAGLWLNANNNYLTLRMPYSLYLAPNRIPTNYQTESGNPKFEKSWLSENLNGRSKFVSVSSDVYGPSFSVKAKSWQFGLFTLASGNVRVNRISEALAHAVYNEFDSAAGAYSLFDESPGIGPFNASGNARLALGLNVSKAIELDWKRQLLLGASIKKIWGMQGFHFETDGLEYRQVDSDSIVVSPTNLELVNYGDKMGRGMGVDLGLTYVFHKKDFKRHGEYAKHHTRYFAKLGLSVLDIGSVKYDNASFRSVSLVNETGVSLNTTYTGSSDYLNVLDSFMNEFGSYTASQGDYKVGLPTRMVLSGDFQVRKNLFLGTILSQSFRNRNSHHARYQSFMMVAPRLEYRYFEFSLPAIVEYDYRAFRMGASFRFGPLYLGTNSLMSFLNTKSVKDADLFIGIAFGNLSGFSFKNLAKSKLRIKKAKAQKCFSF